MSTKMDMEGYFNIVSISKNLNSWGNVNLQLIKAQIFCNSLKLVIGGDLFVRLIQKNLRNYYFYPLGHHPVLYKN